VSDFVPAKRVRITVVETAHGGKCPMGYKLGDEFEVVTAVIPTGMCMWAWQAMMPYITALRLEGKILFSDKPDEIEICCPDNRERVVFRLKALPPLKR